ncbi:phosphate transport system protein [Desulfitispora alkaliphila]|uniref:phosphate signaling complex protein PhoU n=1 Tax=Desulfitispora alkaliphila TaxID=622674 RepID=UPI003D1CC236
MERPLNTYEKAILNLQKDICSMGSEVSKLLKLALEALLEQDKDKANQIIQLENEIDDQDYEIEMRALELISLQQPLDEDLRVLAAVMRITKDLERIGDLAVNVAKTAIKLADSGAYFKPLIDIPKMAELTREMLEESLDSYLHNNIELALTINKKDDQVDRLFHKLYQELIDYMKANANYVEQASCFILVARYLERIGDHAVNIAEMTIYQLSGERRPFKK